MAKANHTVDIFGVTYGPDEVFGPSTLRRMFGARLPAHFRIDRDGSVPVTVVARHLQRQGEMGLRMMLEESEIVAPATPQALANF